MSTSKHSIKFFTRDKLQKAHHALYRLQKLQNEMVLQPYMLRALADDMCVTMQFMEEFNFSSIEDYNKFFIDCVNNRPALVQIFDRAVEKLNDYGSDEDKRKLHFCQLYETNDDGIPYDDVKSDYVLSCIAYWHSEKDGTIDDLIDTCYEKDVYDAKKYVRPILRFFDDKISLGQLQYWATEHTPGRFPTFMLDLMKSWQHKRAMKAWGGGE